MKKHGLLLVLSCSVFALVACGGGNQPASSDTSSTSTTSQTSESSDTSEPIAAQPANGVFNYQKESMEERTKILGALEKYAVENKLTGLTLYGDGGYVMYNPSVVKGTNTYIPGYGFGILAEGSLTGDLEGENNPDWKRYYHQYETEDPLNINYMDDKGAVVGDLIGYVSAGYFDTQMNEFKDSYEWVGDLSTRRRPIPINADEKGYTDTFRIEVKVGKDLKYSTTSEKYAAFNNREVTLEDYITPYKIYYTQKYAMARGSEKLSGAGSIAGSKAYYDASKDGFNEEAWKNIGIKAIEEEGKSYLEFQFNSPCTVFYAMYYLTSGMYAPVPAEFIEAIGGGDFLTGTKNWGKFSDNGESIIDHWLCTGPYMFERWDKNQQIVFKKNPNYADRGRYQIAGVHVNILTAANDDPEAGFKEFLANKLHGSGIPSTQLEEYRNDPRTTVTVDSSTFKLNLNTCDAETWESLFGVNGSIEQTPTSQYWEVEPAMHNKDFVSGLSFALDRQTLAATLGRSPSSNYFGNGYMSDPENGVRYNDTQAHKDAVEPLMAGTDGFGFSLEKAKASFQKAAEQLIADGVYEEGDEITIEIAWQTNAQIQREGGLIGGMLTTAFNTDENPLTLKVENWVGANWYDVYYDKMMIGQFDIGFGSVSGNTLDPINFLEVLKSDNSSTFTLNWGLDTNANDPDHLIEYDGKLWSFDALWTVADHGGYVLDGASAPIYDWSDELKMVRDGDGNLVVSGKVREVLILKEGVEEPKSISDTLAYSMFYAFVLYGQTGDTYHETDPVMLGDGLTVTPLEGDPYYTASFECIFDKDEVATYETDTDRLGFDWYFASSLLGSKMSVAYAGSTAIKPGSIPAFVPAE